MKLVAIQKQVLANAYLAFWGVYSFWGKQVAGMSLQNRAPFLVKPGRTRSKELQATASVAKLQDEAGVVFDCRRGECRGWVRV